MKGASAAVQKDVRETLAKVEESVFPSFHSYVTENYEELAGYQSLDSVVVSYIDDTPGLSKDSWSGAMVRWTLGAALDAAEYYASEQISDDTGMGEKMLKAACTRCAPPIWTICTTTFGA